MMRMQPVPTIMGTSPVIVTLDFQEMERVVLVSLTKCTQLILFYVPFIADMTCFLPEDRVYECGVNLSEIECEASGCCYNSSADIQCYYTSGKWEK